MPKTKTDDPRKLMTDHTKYMTRSLHTPRIVSIVALKLIDDSNRSLGPTEAVRRALRFLNLPDNYDADVDPTMKQCITLVKKGLG